MIADEPAPRPVRESRVALRGLIWDIVRDDVQLDPHRAPVTREYQRHPGAVTVLALDGDERVAFVRQYRHPVRMDLWELPAGLLDVDGEDPLAAAVRELAEEADLRAERWDVLAEWFNSPGGSNEVVRIYLARGLTVVPHHERHDRQDEEAGMTVTWVPLVEARDAVLAGRVHNPGAVIGVLAACESRNQRWSTLRPVDAPWPIRR